MLKAAQQVSGEPVFERGLSATVTPVLGSREGRTRWTSPETMADLLCLGQGRLASCLPFYTLISSRDPTIQAGP